jgi:hypothetical protein
MNIPIPIPNTLRVVVDCWMKAEKALRDAVKEKYHDLDEECVTVLFYGELGSVLCKASQEKIVADAFLRDLRRAFPKAQSLGSMTTNLIAEVVLHKRETEKFTGGDFGLTLVRPILSPGGAWAKGERGLLCQAKIKRRSGEWGEIKGNQEQVLSDRTRYLALLLYKYLDPTRKCLDAFKWQLCRGMNVDEVKVCLAKSAFPSCIDSKEVIERLGNANAGTSDPRMIREIVRPTGTPHLELRIFWPDGKVPPPNRLQHLVEQELKQQIQRGVAH